jgi:hypothetical protein
LAGGIYTDCEHHEELVLLILSKSEEKAMSGGWRHSEASKKKISQSMTGKKLSAATRKKLSAKKLAMWKRFKELERAAAA